ncbi:MAG: hypothetical protein FWE27_03190 [Defluviitaleaceae bacterium]|nr:hypothetical protein [Defluviitaleaceae bacterium]
MPPHIIVLAISDEYIYTIQRPTDVQWNWEAPESTSSMEFQGMMEQIEFIINNFKLT